MKTNARRKRKIKKTTMILTKMMQTKRRKRRGRIRITKKESKSRRNFQGPKVKQ